MTAPASLRRDIGFTGSAFLAFNGMVGASIFALPATLAADFGAFSPWLFPLFGILALTVAVPLARVAALHDVSGGPAAYAAHFGPAAAFQVGWLYYVARVTALAANANVFATYLAATVPPLGDSVGRALVILMLVGGITLANIVGLKRALRLLDALTLLKALPLVIVAIAALACWASAIPAPGPLPAPDSVETAALLILYAFVGFENSLVPAGETNAARRTIPRALIATMLGTALLYVLVQLAFIAVAPAGAADTAPLVALGAAVAGPAGAAVILVAALASVAGNITGSVTSTPRVTLALAERGALPGWFGIVHPRWHTPANSILFMGAVGLVLALSGSFVWLAIVSTLARMIVYGVGIAALPRARAAAGMRTSVIDGVLMIAGIAVCLWAAVQSEARSWLVLALLVGLGSALLVLRRAMRARTR